MVPEHGLAGVISTGLVGLTGRLPYHDHMRDRDSTTTKDRPMDIILGVVGYIVVVLLVGLGIGWIIALVTERKYK
jgi:hypothetical protein